MATIAENLNNMAIELESFATMMYSFQEKQARHNEAVIDEMRALAEELRVSQRQNIIMMEQLIELLDERLR